MSALNFTLPAHPPFSLYAVTHSHGWIHLAPFEEEPDGGFKYVLHLNSGRVVGTRVKEAHEGITVEVDSLLNSSERVELEEKITWMLELDQDFSTFHNLAWLEQKLAHVLERSLGRILRSPTLFEDVIKTILTTNTLWAATIRMNRNLVSQFGAPLPSDPERRAFPTPERLAETDEATLRLETRLGYRAPYVLDLARRSVSGELELESLKTASLPTPELRKELMAIKGVGDYAAANLLMLLGRYDFIPVDSWALKMVSNEWHDGAPIGRAEVEAAFERWGEWKGLVYWLWDWSKM
jgi:3-methyladenine DNA glycosylase/8-oxoguanine DNA glycosylase